MNLTPKQLHILTRIRDLRNAQGFSPTMQELADELGVSKVTVFEHVQALVKKGALKRKANHARSLEISPGVTLPDEERMTRVPLIGAIAAGSPIDAVQDRQHLDFEQLFPMPQKGQTGSIYALRVRGDSMIDEHIRDGDYVVVEKCDRARNGQTVVALLDGGEATLKKFYKEGQKIRLQPANDKYEPIYVNDCKIQGKVIGVLRTYNN